MEEEIKQYLVKALVSLVDKACPLIFHRDTYDGLMAVVANIFATAAHNGYMAPREQAEECHKMIVDEYTNRLKVLEFIEIITEGGDTC